MDGTHSLTLHDQQLTLLPQRAIYWHNTRTLLVADLHFGKTATFRSAGIPIPPGTTRTDLQRLDQLLANTQATRLILLGDFLHSRFGREPQLMNTLGDWFAAKCATTQTLLIRGNHDSHAGPLPADWPVTTIEESLFEAPFVFRHEPKTDKRGFTFAGHLHPAIRLAGPGRSLRADCFWFGSQVAVLPAFGSFTGSATVQPVMGDRLFAVGDDEVIEIRSVPAVPPSKSTTKRKAIRKSNLP